MVAIETTNQNYFSTTLTVGVTPLDMSFTLDNIGTLTSPCYLVIDPTNDLKREVVLFDGTWNGNTLVSNNNRALEGTGGDGSAKSHDPGTLVVSVPLAQHLRDVHDRIDDHKHDGATNDTTVSHNDLTDLSADSHFQYVLVDGTRALTGPLLGVDGVDPAALTTKGYVDAGDAATLGSAQAYADSGDATVQAGVDFNTSAIAGLQAFPHSDYLLRDGSRTVTGDLRFATGGSIDVVVSDQNILWEDSSWRYWWHKGSNNDRFYLLSNQGSGATWSTPYPVELVGATQQINLSWKLNIDQNITLTHGAALINFTGAGPHGLSFENGVGKLVWRTTPNTLGLENASEVAAWETDIDNFITTFNGPVNVLQGTPSNLGLRFAGDTDTGLTRNAADQLAVVTGGVARYVFGNSAFIPNTSNSFRLGTSSFRWQEIWTNAGAINSSGADTKRDIEASDLGLNFITRLSPRKWKMAVGEVIPLREGDPIIVPGERPHYGLVAEEVKAVIDALGVDFAGYVDPNVGRDAPEEGPPLDLGLRYTEFIGPLIRSVQELAERLDNAGL